MWWCDLMTDHSIWWLSSSKEVESEKKFPTYPVAQNFPTEWLKYQMTRWQLIRWWLLWLLMFQDYAMSVFSYSSIRCRDFLENRRVLTTTQCLYTCSSRKVVIKAFFLHKTVLSNSKFNINDLYMCSIKKLCYFTLYMPIHRNFIMIDVM